MVDAEVYRAKGDGKNRIYMVDPWLPGTTRPRGWHVEQRRGLRASSSLRGSRVQLPGPEGQPSSSAHWRRAGPD